MAPAPSTSPSSSRTGWAAASAPPTSPGIRSTRGPTPSSPASPKRCSCAGSSASSDELVAPGRGPLDAVVATVGSGPSRTAWCSASPASSARSIGSGMLSPPGVPRAGLDLVLPRGRPPADAHRPGADRRPVRRRGRRSAGRPAGRRASTPGRPGTWARPRWSRNWSARGRAVPQPAAGPAGAGGAVASRPEPAHVPRRPGRRRPPGRRARRTAWRTAGTAVRAPDRGSRHGRPGRRRGRWSPRGRAASTRPCIATRAADRPVDTPRGRRPLDRPLAEIPTASVALVTVALAGHHGCQPGSTGSLCPRASGRLMTACSFASNKWPHWADPGHAVVRVSAGGPATTGPSASTTTPCRPAAGRAGGGPRRSPCRRAAVGSAAGRTPSRSTWSGHGGPYRRGGSRPGRRACRPWPWPAPPTGGRAFRPASPRAAGPPQLGRRSQTGAAWRRRAVGPTARPGPLRSRTTASAERLAPRRPRRRRPAGSRPGTGRRSARTRRGRGRRAATAAAV